MRRFYNNSLERTSEEFGRRVDDDMSNFPNIILKVRGQIG